MERNVTQAEAMPVRYIGNCTRRNTSERLSWLGRLYKYLTQILAERERIAK